MKKQENLGKIMSIEEVTFGIDSGYWVRTDTHTVRAMIHNIQLCCEDFGYVTSDDDTSYFIGADLLAVEVVDTLCEKIILDVNTSHGGDTMFVEFTTPKGTFQVAFYNAHNGCYGHTAFIAIDDKLIHTDCL